MIYIIYYLSAIVLANLAVAQFGPGVTIINAFVFIGLDLTSRDRLHERWRNNRLWLKMFLLISAGSAISYLLNINAARIALASLVSFLISGLIDAIIYHLLINKGSLLKINGSNLVSAAADSFIFTGLAFGSFIPVVILGQYLAKISGGFIWSILLNRRPDHGKR